MKATDPALKVRLDPDVKEWLRKAAGSNCRSMNGEINALLKAAMAAQTMPPASAGSEPAAGEASRA